MVTRPSHDLGAIEALVVLALAALAGFSLVIAVCGAFFVGHERTRSAADLAALAGAASQDCAVARETALRNGATLRSCALVDNQAEVAVSRSTGFGAVLLTAGAPAEHQAVARAEL